MYEDKKYDYVVIGSGLGGLFSALILGKEGHSVCVLEKNNQYGGNLQTFVRDRTIFDTGVHYLGGLAPGQNLYRYFKYMGIIDDLEIMALDEEGFDIITFDEDDTEYKHAQGFARFVDTLSKQFPGEEKAIQQYVDKLIEVAGHFPLYDVKKGQTYSEDRDIFTLGARAFIDSLTENEKLRAVLGGSNLLYAGDGDKSPLYVHALSVNAYIQSASRIIKGGSQITKYLVRELRRYGVDIFKHHEVVGFEFDGDLICEAKCSNGKRIKGGEFISNIDPKLTIRLAGPERFRKSYVNRVNRIESTIGSFCVYIVLKPETFPYLNRNYYHFRSMDDVWNSQDYTQESWPNGYMVSMGLKDRGDKWADSMTIMTYMRYDEVSPWADTFNTVADQNSRGKTYEEFKQECEEKMIAEVEKKFPELRSCIKEVYSSTPLSYRDYISCDSGGMYGYVKDIENPFKSFISPRTKIKNLFFTGQCLNMHGILGVTISAITTCSEFLGKDYILDKIHEVAPATEHNT